ncbi:MAG TPA: TonB family protein [Burkholderiales bacterium]|nr:TonB family protein [Burkholderiales bacterium]
MAALASSFDVAMKQTWTRLLVAVACSFALHLLLVAGVPVNPTGGTPGITSTASSITAQLEPASADVEPRAVDERNAPSPGSGHASPATRVAEHRDAAAPASSPSAGVEVPLIRDPVYYPVKQLDVQPRPLVMIKPAYPAAALAARVNGVVTLLLLIDEFGVVNEVDVVNADPPGYFEDAAPQAFRGARFAPAQRHGYPVKSRVLIKLNYDYEAEQHAQQQR